MRDRDGIREKDRYRVWEREMKKIKKERKREYQIIDFRDFDEGGREKKEREIEKEIEGKGKRNGEGKRKRNEI